MARARDVAMIPIGADASAAAFAGRHSRTTARRRASIASVLDQFACLITTGRPWREGGRICCKFETVANTRPGLTLYGQQDYRQAADALRAVDEDALDIGGRRWALHKNAVASFKMRSVPIGVMQLVHDADRIKQYHEMLRQESQRIDLQLGFAQPDRAGFCDSES